MRDPRPEPRIQMLPGPDSQKADSQIDIFFCGDDVSALIAFLPTTMNEEPGTTETGTVEYLDDPVLCVHCLEVIPWDANLCVRCKAPQNFIASTDPYQRIHAEGFILRTAAEKPRSWLTVIGIWLLVGSWSIPMLLLLVVGWQMANLFGYFRIEFFGPLLISLAGTVLVVRTTVNFLTWRRGRNPGASADPEDPD